MGMIKSNIEDNKKNGKAGALYLRIANNCLMSWFTGIPNEERSELIGRRDMKELEVYIRANNSIRAGSAVIWRAIAGICGVQFSLEEFIDIILWSDTPNGDFEELNVMLNGSMLSNERKASIAVEAMVAIHERWMRDYPDKFSDPERVDRQYMFMPIEMIGVTEAMKDYIFIADILTVLGLWTERRFVEGFYRERRRQFRDYVGLSDEKSLTEFIRKSADVKYSAILGDFTRQLSREEVASRIAAQIVKHCGEPSTW